MPILRAATQYQGNKVEGKPTQRRQAESRQNGMSPERESYSNQQPTTNEINTDSESTWGMACMKYFF